MKGYEGKLFIDGEWKTSIRGVVEEVRSPYNNEVVGISAVASLADVELALSSAVKGAEVWRRTPAHQRFAVMMKAAELADSRVEEMAQLISSENGKSLLESRGEAGRSGEIIRLAAFEGAQLYGS